MKSRILLCVLLIVTLLGSMAVYATEDVNAVSEELEQLGEIETDLVDAINVEPDDSIGEGEPKEEVNQDVYMFSSLAKLENKSVDGNVFVKGEEANIKNTIIYGDLFILGQNVKIENTYIYGNVFALGEYMSMSKTSAYGNLYSLGSSLDFAGLTVQDAYIISGNTKLSNGSYIARNLYSIGDSSNIKDIYVGNNASMTASNISLDETTVIAGKLTYSAEKEANIAKGATIGEVEFKKIEASESEKEVSTKSAISSAVYSVVTLVIKTIFVAGFIILFAKQFIEKQKVDNVAKHLGKSLLKGILATILIPIIALLLLLTGVAFGLTSAIIMIYITMFIISSSLVSLSIATTLTKNKECNAWKFYGTTLLIALVIGILEQIPVIGWRVMTLVGLTGMGLIFSTLKMNKSKKEEQVEVASKE